MYTTQQTYNIINHNAFAYILRQMLYLDVSVSHAYNCLLQVILCTTKLRQDRVRLAQDAAFHGTFWAVLVAVFE